MALIIPTQPVPAQTLTVNLANQACQILIRQLSTGMFLDLYVNDQLIIGGVICQNQNRIVRDAYLGFVGDLEFIDNNAAQGVEGQDPVYTGLGTQFDLVYLEAADIAAEGDV